MYFTLFCNIIDTITLVSPDSHQYRLLGIVFQNIVLSYYVTARPDDSLPVPRPNGLAGLAFRRACPFRQAGIIAEFFRVN